MMKSQINTSGKICKVLAILLSFLLIFEQSGFAQIAGQLDISGHLAGLRNVFSPDVFRPLHLRYLSYNPTENNFQLFLDKGSLKNPPTEQIKETTRTLLNYFFIGITLPNDTFWINLRPDAEDNIIDDRLAKTDVGKILLESDLQLKKDTAKFTSPETPEGREYWDKLYRKAGEIFGSENITIPTLTRPWIVPDEIIIRETADSAYIYKATLKVMLEQDYLKDSAVYNFKDDRLKELNEYSSQLIREIILPKLTKEVNSSKRYASLRQVYYSLIMAQWFKARHYGKDGLYAHLIDRRDLTSLTSKESWSKTTYFKDYQKSFKDGEYNIQETIGSLYGQTIRSYFSGGTDLNLGPMTPFGAVAGPSSKGSNLSLGPAASSPVVDPKVVIGVKVNATDKPGELVNVQIENERVATPLEQRQSLSSQASSPVKERKDDEDDDPPLNDPDDFISRVLFSHDFLKKVAYVIKVMLTAGVESGFNISSKGDTSTLRIGKRGEAHGVNGRNSLHMHPVDSLPVLSLGDIKSQQVKGNGVMFVIGGTKNTGFFGSTVNFYNFNSGELLVIAEAVEQRRAKIKDILDFLEQLNAITYFELIPGTAIDELEAYSTRLISRSRFDELLRLNNQLYNILEADRLQEDQQKSIFRGALINLDTESLISLHDTTWERIRRYEKEPHPLSGPEGESYSHELKTNLLITEVTHQIISERLGADWILRRSSSPIPDSEQLANSQEKAIQVNQKFGGIDFRALPIVTQAMGNLTVNINSASLGRLTFANLNAEWLQIENMVNSGIIPSAERIKGFIQASCYRGNIGRDIDKVISCISDVLRIEEERYSPTEPMLKDILVVLDSANSAQQLKALFIGTAP